ncbi:hypothetical protein ACS0TY_011013 [Phlomoides rotata]
MTHLVTIKHNSMNYLMWYGQIYPLLVTRKFLPYVDGSSPPPPATVTEHRSTIPNSDHPMWFAQLLAQAESRDLFTKSLDSPSSLSQAPAFLGHSSRPSTSGSKGSGSHYTSDHENSFGSGGGSTSSNRGNNKQDDRGRDRYTPKCHICKIDGHYADACPQ